MVKCKICNRYIEAREFINAKVCSAICYGESGERQRVIRVIEKFIDENVSYWATYDKDNNGDTSTTHLPNKLKEELRSKINGNNKQS